MSYSFTDRPFVAGTIVGIRAFKVVQAKKGRFLTRAPHLTGPVFDHYKLRVDENVARCAADPTLNAIGRLLSGRVGREPRRHRPGSLACRCGFYAYLNCMDCMDCSRYATSGNVVGIIEGYGLVTVGDRGFRCEKARLKALVGVVGEELTFATPETPYRPNWLIDGKPYPFGTRFIPRAITKAYSNVPVFAKLDKALAEFPLTQLKKETTHG